MTEILCKASHPWSLPISSEKTEGILDSTQSALSNVNDATADMRSITTKIDQGQGTAGALINNREIYNDMRATVADTRETVNQAKAGMTSFQENMQALKSNWFLRGFFKNRGYQDTAELTKHAIAKLPDRPFSNRFEIGATDLFDKPDTAKLKNEKVLNQIGVRLERTPYDLIVVAAYSGLRGETEENLVLTQARAMVVRQHLTEHFKIDDQRIKTIGMGEDPATPDKRAARVAIIVYPPQPTQRRSQRSRRTRPFLPADSRNASLARIASSTPSVNPHVCRWSSRAEVVPPVGGRIPRLRPNVILLAKDPFNLRPELSQYIPACFGAQGKPRLRRAWPIVCCRSGCHALEMTLPRSPSESARPKTLAGCYRCERLMYE